MVDARSRELYPVNYRAQELRQIASWIAAGESGAVVGLVGSGRSNLLTYLCQSPDALTPYLGQRASRTILIPVDIYNLPVNDLSCLYRTILHAFYWIQERFEPPTAQLIDQLYREHRAAQDPFLPQKAFYDLLRTLQGQGLSVVLVLNRFDRFCETATPQMINTLRGLRDQFKSLLSFIVGMLQEVRYLPDPAALGDVYELLDSHVCWVGALAPEDARFMLGRVLATTATQPSEAEIRILLDLSGRFPSLLKAVAHWWMAADRPHLRDESASELLAVQSVRHRLGRIWNGLTQEEKLALVEVQQGKLLTGGRSAEQLRMCEQLRAKGVWDQNGQTWAIRSQLLSAYVNQIEGRVRGRLWMDEQARVIYQGQEPLPELVGLQFEILRFLIKNPRVCHTRDDIIDNAWPEEEQREGITPNALQAHIASIRKRIEPNPATPRYLLTWHGRPGGYQFFPEGKPE
jgi:hypothetical protein